MSLFKNIQTNAEMENLISGMEIMLNDAKYQNPNKNYLEQEKRIKTLRNFQFEFLEMSEQVRISEKVYKKGLIENEKYKIAFEDLSKKNESLEIELTNLKKDIIL